MLTSDNTSSDTRLGINIFNRSQKGVDALHLKNHVRKKCQEDFPQVLNKLRQKFPNPNTEVAEQTFSWLGKFKKLFNKLDKTRHLFMLHCLVIDRNAYTERCFERGVEPSLPRAVYDDTE